MGIVVNDSQNLFMLQTRSNSYAFGIDNQGLVRHLYWGSRKNFLYTEVFDTKNTV